MKKLIMFLTVLVISLACLIPALASNQATVYVTPFGNDNAAGTLDAPLKSLYAAFRALPEGGKVVVCGSITADATVLPESKGLITISSLDAEDYRVSAGEGGSGIIYMGGNITLSSAVKFENLDILVTKKNLVFICNGNYACFGEGITVTTASDEVTLPGIVAGRSGTTPANGTYLEICSGTWNRVRGGSRGTSSAAQTGDACLVIRGGTFNSTIDGGGDSATDGNVYMFIFGGTFNASVNGASAAEVTGNVHISYYGGTINTNSFRLGRGGAIGGNATANLFAVPDKKLSLGASVITGDAIANVDGTINVNTDLIINYVSGDSLEELMAKDSAFIEAAAAAKLPKETGASLGDRDTTASGTTTKASINALGATAGDINKDGKVSLFDALHMIGLIRTDKYSESADADADGKITLKDIIAAVDSAFKNQADISRTNGENRISNTISLFGGATVENNSINRGYAFGTVSDNAYSVYSDVVLGDGGIVGLYFAASKADPSADGYYFEVNTVKKTAALYSVTSGIYRIVGEKNVNFLSDSARIKVTYGASTNKNAAVLYFEDNALVDESYPRFDLSLASLGNAVGIYVENATATLPVVVKEDIPTSTDGYYTNYLFEQFTDPEVFYENGRYYFYGTRSSTQNQGVQCFSTTDFKTFDDEGLILKHGDAFGDGVYKAANIVKCGDYYYLFYMAKSNELDTSVTAYASAKSPVGPFKNADKTSLTGDANFIGGQPFVDDDGQVYLIYARTTGGNKLYGSKITLNEGKATIDLTTEKLLLEPTEPWENAKASVVECGYLVKHEGTYYLLYSGGNYNSTYGTGYATSQSPLGPFVKYEYNPILVSNDQAFGVGAATIFVSPDGSEHFIAYLRNFSPTVVRPLLTCIDRVRFVDNPNGGADIIEMYGPTVNPQLLPSGLGENTITDYQTARFHW